MRPTPFPSPQPPGFGLARVLSKLGRCSRSQGRELILAGWVRVNGKVCRDPEARTDPRRDRIQIDEQPVESADRVYLMLNKPRGLVTTRADEQGRPTIYACLQDQGLPWISPVGRLDKASEGLLLLSNDTHWAQQLLDPQRHVEKRYHVQITCLASRTLCQRLVQGVVAQDGERLAAVRAAILRLGEKNSWIEIVLDEGKNRHIRRLLAACGIDVLRLIRVAIGPLELGSLPKGMVRPLTPGEVESLRRVSY